VKTDVGIRMPFPLEPSLAFASCALCLSCALYLVSCILYLGSFAYCQLPIARCNESSRITSTFASIYLNNGIKQEL